MAKVSVEKIRAIQDDGHIQCGMFAIFRETVVIQFLGVPTVMYANDKFNIIDPFGMIVWTDDAEGVSGFMEGLLGGEVEETEGGER